MPGTKAEATDLLTRLSLVDLVNLVTCKAAMWLRDGNGSLTIEGHATAPPGPTAAVRVRVTAKRKPKRARSRAPGKSRKGAA